MRTIIVVFLCLVFLSGCGFKDYNSVVATQNANRFKAFTEGLNASKSEGARIAMAMAFASNMGQEQLARPETARDYIRTLAPFVTPLYSMFSSRKQSSSSVNAGRDVYMNSTRSDVNEGSNITDTFGTEHEVYSSRSDATAEPYLFMGEEE
jgi:hypothetical protein